MAIDNSGKPFGERSQEEQYAIETEWRASDDWNYVKQWFLYHFEPSQFLLGDMEERASPAEEITIGGMRFARQTIDGRTVFVRPQDIMAFHFGEAYDPHFYELVGKEIFDETRVDAFILNETRLGDPNAVLGGREVHHWQSKQVNNYDSKVALKEWFFDHFEPPPVSKEEIKGSGFSRRDFSREFATEDWYEKNGLRIYLYDPYDAIVLHLGKIYDYQFLENLNDEIIKESGVELWQEKSFAEIPYVKAAQSDEPHAEITREDAVKDLADRLAKLEEAIGPVDVQDEPAAAGIGHNNPPLDIDEADDIYAENSVFIQEGPLLAAGIREVKEEIRKPEIATETLEKSASKFALLFRVFNDVYNDTRKYGIKYFMKYGMKSLFSAGAGYIFLGPKGALIGLILSHIPPILNSMANLINSIANLIRAIKEK